MGFSRCVSSKKRGKFLFAQNRRDPTRDRLLGTSLSFFAAIRPSLISTEEETRGARSFVRCCTRLGPVRPDFPENRRRQPLVSRALNVASEAAGVESDCKIIPTPLSSLCARTESAFFYRFASVRSDEIGARDRRV